MLTKIRSLLFENQNLRQTIIKNTFWLSFGELSGRFLRVGVIIYAARILGAEGWGVFSYAITLAALFTIFSDIGLSSVLTREVARDKENRQRYFSTVFVIKIVLIIIFFLLVMFTVPYISKIKLTTSLLLFTALTFIFDSLRNFGNGVFRASEKMEQEALVNIITQTGILIFGFWILLKSASPENLAMAYAIGSLIGLIVAIFLLRSYLKDLLTHFDKKLLGPLFNAAWPFGLVGVLGAVMINTDTIMIGWMQNATQVGFYSAAQKPILLLYILPSLIAGAFFPSLSRFAHKEKEKFKSLLESGLTFVFLLSIPFAVGIFLTADKLTYLFYGAEYEPAILTLKILSITVLSAYPASLIGNSIFAYNLQKILVAYSAIGALGNIFFNYLLIPVWGINGAAIATLFTQTLSVGFIWWKMKKLNYFEVINFKNLWKIILSTILMSIFVILLDNFLSIPILITIPLAGAIYLLSLLILKEKIILEIKNIL